MDQHLGSRGEWGPGWISPPTPCPLHLAKDIQQASNVCSMVPKWEQEISDHLWAIRETATPLYLFGDTHLRVAGFPSNWAAGVIEDLIDSFVGSGQEARSLLRNLSSGFRDHRGTWKKNPFPHQVLALPLGCGSPPGKMGTLSHSQGQRPGSEGGYIAVLAQ